MIHLTKLDCLIFWWGSMLVFDRVVYIYSNTYFIRTHFLYMLRCLIFSEWYTSRNRSSLIILFTSGQQNWSIAHDMQVDLNPLKQGMHCYGKLHCARGNCSIVCAGWKGTVDGLSLQWHARLLETPKDCNRDKKQEKQVKRIMNNWI